MAFYDVYVKKAYTTDRATIRLPSNITGYEFMTNLRQIVPHNLNIANINNMEFVLMGQNMNLGIPAEEGIAFIPQNNELVNNIFGNVNSIEFYIRPIRPNNMNNIEYNIMMNNIIHHNNNMIDNNNINHHNNIHNINDDNDDDDNDDYDVNGANNFANDGANNGANDDANANTRPTESLKCIICLSNSRVIRFDPCGHLICCDTCSRHPSLITCPTCRVRIELRQITYIS